MPKVKFTPKPALAKLPLSVRKDREYLDVYLVTNIFSCLSVVRDNFEANKEVSEQSILELLGIPFAIDFNPNEVLAYVSDLSTFDSGRILNALASQLS